MQEKARAEEGRSRLDPARAGAGGTATATPSGGMALAVFTATTFLSALLLFSVQPMFAKMVLPILGGSPSVWAVAMVFFQAALLAGYCYAHILISRTRPWVGGLIHLGLCAVALLALPIAVPSSFGEPPAGDPALWQLGLFAAGVGLPFLAVSANAPLLQAWFAASGHVHARDPYFLYGASNLGSLIALLAYPLVLEPAFGLAALSWVWAGGFLLLVAFILLSVLTVRQAASLSGGDAARAPGAAATTTTTAAPIAEQPPTLARRIGWVALAFVPSALLTAFTTHITMDVASAPLLWVLPLAVYLLTFVLVFRDRPIALIPTALLVGLGAYAAWPYVESYIPSLASGRDGARIAGVFGAILFAAAWYLFARAQSMVAMRAAHIAALILALLALSQTEHEGWFITATTGFAVFFASTMVAHRTLYEMRPSASRLTEFYLLMSLGGVLGGLFAALLAPRLFSQIFEYPILLTLTVACRPGALSLSFARDRRDDLLVLWLVAAASALAIIWLPQLVGGLPAVDSATMPPSAWWLRGLIDIYMGVRLAITSWGSTAALAFLFSLAVLAFWRHPARQLAVAAAMCATIVLLPSGVRRSDAQRSYFGVYRVYESGRYNILTHGTTLHGAQKMRDEFGASAVDATPGTYYHPASPMAKAVETVRANVTANGGTARFGVIGLGAGSLACLAAEGEKWRFFEIDPLMVSIASDPKNFTYLESCQPKPPDIVTGDARLTLAKEPAGAFDIIIVDAFTSDAVPIHLMTAEAIRLYLARTSPNGVAVLHISNRYLDLDSVLGATIDLVPGAHGLILADNEADGSYATTTSTVAIFAKTSDALEPFRQLNGVSDLDAKGLKPWTDDYSDIIGPFLSKLKD